MTARRCHSSACLGASTYRNGWYHGSWSSLPPAPSPRCSITSFFRRLILAALPSFSFLGFFFFCTTCSSAKNSSSPSSTPSSSSGDRRDSSRSWTVWGHHVHLPIGTAASGHDVEFHGLSWRPSHQELTQCWASAFQVSKPIKVDATGGERSRGRPHMGGVAMATHCSAVAPGSGSDTGTWPGQRCLFQRVLPPSHHLQTQPVHSRPPMAACSANTNGSIGYFYAYT